MTRMNTLPPGEPIAVAPIKTFPLIKDLVTDVSFNYAVAREIPAFRPRAPDRDGTYPDTSPEWGKSNIVVRIGPGGEANVSLEPLPEMPAELRSLVEQEAKVGA